LTSYFYPIYLKIASKFIVLDVVFLASLELDTVDVLLCYTLSNFDHYIKFILYLNSTQAIKRQRKCLCTRINHRSLYIQTCFCTLRSLWSILDTTLCDSVCQCIPVSSTNNTDRHDITEILLKVALNTIKEINKPLLCCHSFTFSLSYLMVLTSNTSMVTLFFKSMFRCRVQQISIQFNKRLLKTSRSDVLKRKKS
jgi:hypothetical protein